MSNVRRRLVVVCVAGLALAAGSIGPAAAATKPPGLLVATDLPATFQAAAPTTNTTFNALVVDGTACTETPQPIVGLSGALTVVFGRTAPTTSGVVSESVVSFPKAKAARAAFAVQAKSAKAAVACGTVGFVPPTTTAVISNVTIAKVPFAKVGDSSVATSANPVGTAAVSNFVIFLKGPYIVTVGASAGPTGLSAAELKAIVGRAQKRLKG